MTADAYTQDGLSILSMGTGNDNNTWGDNATTKIFQILLDAVTNTLSETVTGGTLDLSGAVPAVTSSQTRFAGIIVNGTLSSNQTIVVPNFNKWWFVQNNTAGAHSLFFKTSTGIASSAIPQNSGWQMLYCDGSNNMTVWPFNTLQIQMPDGSATAPPYSNINETRSGWYRNGTQDWRFAINGSDVLQITGAGAGTPSVVNVLTPNSLEVNGTNVSGVPAGAEMPFAGISAPSGWYFEYGQAVSRTTDSTLFAAITTTATGDTHTSTTVNNLSTDLRGLGLEGAILEGTGLSTGTTIVSVDSATSMTITPAASSSNAGTSLRILPWGQGDGSTTFNLPDRRGRGLYGRDNMGGTAASRLSVEISATHLNATTAGSDGVTISRANLPNVDLAGNLTGTVSGIPNTAISNGCVAGSGSSSPYLFGSTQSNSVNFGGNIYLNGNVSQTVINNLGPSGMTNFIIKR